MDGDWGRGPPERKRRPGGGGDLGNISNNAKPHTSAAGDPSTTRAERRRRHALWRRAMRGFHKRAAGLFDLTIVRAHYDYSPAIAVAVLNWFGVTFAASEGEGMLCLNCDRTFSRKFCHSAFLVVAPIANAQTPEMAILTGICPACADRSDADLLVVAQHRLKGVWPDLRRLDAANLHTRGGRA